MVISNIEMMKIELRDNRIKHGVDYAIVHKYSKTRVLCHKIWQDEITEIAKKHGVTIHEWYTYE